MSYNDFQINKRAKTLYLYSLLKDFNSEKSQYKLVILGHSQFIILWEV